MTATMIKQCRNRRFYVQVYSEQIGNLMIDALSAKKYYHFVRLMGRAASHITLECALQTHPQAAIICEEVQHSKQRLADIVREVPCLLPTDFGRLAPCLTKPLLVALQILTPPVNAPRRITRASFFSMSTRHS